MGKVPDIISKVFAVLTAKAIPGIFLLLGCTFLIVDGFVIWLVKSTPNETYGFWLLIGKIIAGVFGVALIVLEWLWSNYRKTTRVRKELEKAEAEGVRRQTEEEKRKKKAEEKRLSTERTKTEISNLSLPEKLIIIYCVRTRLRRFLIAIEIDFS